MAFALRDYSSALVAVPVAALVVGSPPVLVFGGALAVAAAWRRALLVRREANTRVRPLRLGCLVGAGAVAVCALADSPLHSTPIAGMFATLLGFASGTAEGRGREVGRPDLGLAPRALLSGGFALVAWDVHFGSDSQRQASAGNTLDASM